MCGNKPQSYGKKLAELRLYKSGENRPSALVLRWAANVQTTEKKLEMNVLYERSFIVALERGEDEWAGLKSVGKAKLERVSPFDWPTWLDLVLEFSA